MKHDVAAPDTSGAASSAMCAATRSATTLQAHRSPLSASDRSVAQRRTAALCTLVALMTVAALLDPMLVEAATVTGQHKRTCMLTRSTQTLQRRSGSRSKACSASDERTHPRGLTERVSVCTASVPISFPAPNRSRLQAVPVSFLSLSDRDHAAHIRLRLPGPVRAGAADGRGRGVRGGHAAVVLRVAGGRRGAEPGLPVQQHHGAAADVRGRGMRRPRPVQQDEGVELRRRFLRCAGRFVRANTRARTRTHTDVRLGGLQLHILLLFHGRRCRTQRVRQAPVARRIQRCATQPTVAGALHRRTGAGRVRPGRSGHMGHASRVAEARPGGPRPCAHRNATSSARGRVRIVGPANDLDATLEASGFSALSLSCSSRSSRGPVPVPVTVTVTASILAAQSTSALPDRRLGRVAEPRPLSRLSLTFPFSFTSACASRRRRGHPSASCAPLVPTAYPAVAASIGA